MKQLLANFLIFKELINQEKVKTINSKFNNIIQKYDFIHVSNELDNYPYLLQNILNSKEIVINYIIKEDKNINNSYFIAGFEKTVIFINALNANLFQTLLSNNPNATIFFLSDIRSNFEQFINVPNDQHEIDETFLTEIDNFNEKLGIYIKNIAPEPIIEVWEIIRSCISGYLIKKSYSKLNNKHDFSEKKTNIKVFKIKDFIELRTIGFGSTFLATLVYHIENEEIFVIKKIYGNNPENEKLLQREIENYKCLNYPLIPKFYGIIEGQNNPVIEFIKGKTLSKINQNNFSENDKVTIIFQLIMVFNYLHSHKEHFVYRDLKPNNIMIDENKRVFVIDFDRMAKTSDIESGLIKTADLQENYTAPEVHTGHLSPKCDIYSIGKMIKNIFKEAFIETSDKEIINDNLVIQSLYSKCTKDNFEERLTILELMIVFYLNFYLKINISIIPEDLEVIFIHGIFFNSSQYISLNIDKSIKYYLIAANQLGCRPRSYGSTI
ncbi:hypothetical protein M9Y10_018326 [Tritrichomonas musculus]|uniref:Protein kinase domain-containing protein n=1 Tax=Tritrichomonas musculus TaxID=1915356 RepID=A0ABR2HNA9_9EUKA